MIDKNDLREYFEDYSAEELTAVNNLVNQLLEERATQRYNYLVHQILSAVHCLEKEFPCSEISFPYDGEDINLMDYTWSEDNFHQ